MYVLSIYVIVLQIVLQIVNVLKPADTEQSNIIWYIILSLGTLLLGIVYFILFTCIRKKKILSVFFKQFAVHSFLYLYVGIQLAFCTLNIMETGGVDSYYIAILIVGLVPVLSHRQSVITILAAFAYMICFLVLSSVMSQVWDSILLTDVWANLIIITGLTTFLTIFTNNLIISNFIQDVELTAYNQELIDSAVQLEKMANTDELTGLPNRHDLASKLDLLWFVSMRQKRRLAFIMFDIDFFKSYNDTFGHPEGDNCLKQVAESLSLSFRRKEDIVCRYGGEEFLAVIEAGDSPDELVEAARKNIEELKISHAKKTVSPYVTVSGGMCVLIPAQHLTPEHAIKAADEALYRSKEAGRNRITRNDIEDADQEIIDTPPPV
jgi:diguanylate cyclase (GGDEF)-like protein